MPSNRYLYQNLITDVSMITLSSVQSGRVSPARPLTKTGSGDVEATGAFTGGVNVDYMVEIDLAGNVGVATFKWSDTGGQTWNATGVVTSSSVIVLSNNVKVKFTGAAFVVGDKWAFKGTNQHGSGRMLEMNPSSFTRFGTLDNPNTITIDFGSAQTVKALAIYNHNLSASATITLKMHTADSWSSPAFSESISWNSAKILHYLSSAKTYRYLRVEFSDPNNSAGYIDIGVLFPCDYFEPPNVGYGGEFGKVQIKKKSLAPSGVERNRHYNWQTVMEGEYGRLPNTTIDSFQTMLEAVTDKTTGSQDPLFYNLDPADPTEFYLMYIDEIPKKPMTPNKSASAVKLREAVSA